MITRKMMWLPVGLLCLALWSTHAFAGPDEWQRYMEAGLKAQQRGHYAEAQRHFELSLKEAEQLGSEDVRLAMSVSGLAQIYRLQGRYAEAEPLFKRSLEIYEGTVGTDHPFFAASLGSLAELYRLQARYVEAEPLFKRSRAIYTKTLGPEHPKVATSLNNLALLYREQGRLAEAEPLYKRSLAIVEKALGPEHPDVATSLNNWAMLYYSLGRYAEAEPLYKRALTIQEKAHGPEHPDVAVKLSNLAMLYSTLDRYAEAEPLYKRALAIQEKALGPEHPVIARSLNNLALLYETQGRYAEAEPLYKRSLEIWENSFSPNHPKMAEVLANYAILLRNIGRSTEAQEMEARAKAIRAETSTAPEEAPSEGGDIEERLPELVLELYVPSETIVASLPQWGGRKPTQPSSLSRTRLTPAELFRLLEKSVYVVVSAPSQADLKARRGVSQGSAVAISKSMALSNCHVIANGPVIVLLKGDQSHPAEVAFADPSTDRCFLRVQKGQLTPVTGIRPYSQLSVGEPVYTIGSPSGLENTLGEGIVSGLRNNRGMKYIQTSAPISPGSSGGGLFDIYGNLVGITTFLLEGTQNLNFALSAGAFWE